MQKAHIFELAQLLVKLASSERSDVVKQRCAEYLTLAVQWKDEELNSENADEKEREKDKETWLTNTEDLIPKLIGNSQQLVRERARQLFHAFWKRFPTRAEKVYRGLKAQSQNLICTGLSICLSLHLRLFVQSRLVIQGFGLFWGASAHFFSFCSFVF
jgi:uncharacterized membrane protein YdbT with pleckstrin-like domain